MGIGIGTELAVTLVCYFGHLCCLGCADCRAYYHTTLLLLRAFIIFQRCGCTAFLFAAKHDVSHARPVSCIQP